MSTARRPTNVSDDEPTAEELLEQAEKSRTTVSRVLEYVRGERDAGDVRKGDWFAAIEAVRDETGEDLVLYSENDHEDAHASATIYAVDDKFGRAIQHGWSGCRFPSRTAGYTGPRYADRDEIEDGFRFDSGRPRQVLKIDDAKGRLRTFVAAHEDDENGGDA